MSSSTEDQPETAPVEKQQSADPCDKSTEATTAAGSSSEAAEEPKLPPLTTEQHRQLNRLAVMMEYFHDHFRRSWKILYDACTSGRRPSHLTLKQFIDEGINLTSYLETHHSIEETRLYPILARKMPQFRDGRGRDKAELLRQHQAIHAGMDLMADYLRACRSRECELELPMLKDKMDAWGDVLMKHLDQEVDELRAENMRKFWSPEEVRRIPI